MDNKLSPEWCEIFGDAGDTRSWLYAELWRAYFEARRAKRGTLDEQLFETHLTENLMLLTDEVLSDKYQPGRGIAFIVRDPVIREIFAAPFRDRVIHHFLYNGIAKWWDSRLIYDCYSCRVEKGTLFGIKRLDHHIRSATNGLKDPAYAIKMDVRGYFMSLPHEGLFERVVWGLDQQFPSGGPRYKLYKNLWHKIIFDDPTNGVRIRGTVSEWKELPKSKSLFMQPPGRGIVIGNLSSQLLSNIYLDLFDRFIKYDLKYEHYGRYVDDFFLIVKPSEFERAKKDIDLIAQFLASMGLTLHPKKTKIQTVARGVEFLGAVVYPGRIVAGRRVQANFYQALLDVEMGVRGIESVTSYLGICKHFRARRTEARIFKRAGLDYNF